MMAMLSARFWIAVALVIALAVSHFFAYRGGKAAVRADWDRDIAQRAQIALEAEQAARQREQLLIEEKQKAEVLYVQEKRKAAAAALDAQSPLVVRPASVPPPAPELMQEPDLSASYSDSVRQLLQQWLQKLTEWRRSS
jgi:hypothetical protein